jgi:hypothetical protein
MLPTKRPTTKDDDEDDLLERRSESAPRYFADAAEKRPTTKDEDEDDCWKLEGGFGYAPSVTFVMFEQAPRQTDRLSLSTSNNSTHGVTLMRSIGTSIINPGGETK